MLKTDTPSAVAANVAAEEAGLADPDDMELLGECIMELSNCLAGRGRANVLRSENGLQAGTPAPVLDRPDLRRRV